MVGESCGLLVEQRNKFDDHIAMLSIIFCVRMFLAVEAACYRRRW